MGEENSRRINYNFILACKLFSLFSFILIQKLVITIDGMMMNEKPEVFTDT